MFASVLLQSAVAVEPIDPVFAPTMEVVVLGEERLSVATEALDAALSDHGLHRVLTTGHRSWWWSPQIWRPSVMVDQEGFARVRRGAALPLPGFFALPPEDWRRPPLPSRAVSATVKATVVTPSRRAKAAERDRLVDELEPLLHDVRDARWTLARAERGVEIRDKLSRLWFDAAGTEAERLGAIMAYRATFPDSEAWAQQVVDTFLDEQEVR